MRNYLQKMPVLLFVISLILLSACSSDDASNNEGAEEATNEEVSQAEADQSDEKESSDSDSKQESLSDVETILKNSVQAMSQVKGMRISGNTETKTDMMGTTDHETSEIEGEVSLDPVAQHVKIHSNSEMDGTTDSEMYITEEAMYMTDSDADEWTAIPTDQGSAFGDMTALITEAQVKHFKEISDAFELAESDDYYTLTYSGEGDEFKEVAYGVMKDVLGNEGYENFVGMISNAAGLYEITISKETFYTVALSMDYKQVIDLGAKIESEEKSHYEYSDFNEVEAVSVPDEIKDNAQVMEMPDMDMGE